MKFQNIIRPVNRQLERLHDMITVWLIVVIVIVMYIGGSILVSNMGRMLVLDSAVLEVT